MARPRQATKVPQAPSRRHKLPQISEALLAQLWQRQAARQGVLRASNGQGFRVLYPGRQGTEAGPDFRDALVLQEGLGLVRGDLELHLRQQEWEQHGHHRDPRYNGVILHLVLEEKGGKTGLASGATVPVLPLQPLLSAPPEGDAGPNLWALLRRLGITPPADRAEGRRLLARAGDQRFLLKSQAFGSLLKREVPDQVLYEGLMEALGYSQNRQPFLELAGLVPYSRLKQGGLKRNGEGRVPWMEELFLTASGLGAVGSGASGTRKVMDPRRWHLFRVRPGNHPRQRLAGAARLFSRYLEPGLTLGLSHLALQGSARRLVEGLTVTDKQDRTALIGKSRASDMVVNVALPFLHAWGAQGGDGDLPSTALKLYDQQPPLLDNRLTREMEEQLFPAQWRPMATEARRQQGLIHLHHLLAGEGGKGVS